MAPTIPTPLSTTTLFPKLLADEVEDGEEVEDEAPLLDEVPPEAEEVAFVAEEVPLQEAEAGLTEC